MAHGRAAVEGIRRMHGTHALAKGVRRYPPLGERMRALLLAAPGILRERGYEPAPKPYRPRRWKSKIWIGTTGSGRVAVALPAPQLELSELERRIGGLTGWAFHSGRGGGTRPEVVYVLVPEAEPVRLEIERNGRKPRVEVIRAPGVSPAPRTAALKPFHQELRIAIFWEAPDADKVATEEPRP